MAASPYKIADMLQTRSHQQVMSELLDWQNDVFQKILSHRPNLETEIRHAKNMPLHYLPVKEQIAAMGRYRKIIGLNEVLLGLSQTKAAGAVPQALIDQLGPQRAQEVFNISAGLRGMKGSLGSTDSKNYLSSRLLINQVTIS